MVSEGSGKYGNAKMEKWKSWRAGERKSEKATGLESEEVKSKEVRKSKKWKSKGKKVNMQIGNEK